MPRKSDAKKKMVIAAAELFRARGYHGVGLAEILAESGAPKGSFYHHFPNGKDELALEVIESGGRFIKKIIENSFEGVGSVDQAVDSLVDGIADAFQKSGFALGCPVTPLLLELTPSDEIVRKRIEAVLESWVTCMMKHTINLGIQSHELPAYEKAFRALLVTIEGGWIVSRTTHSTEPVLVSKQIYRQILAAEKLNAH